MPREIATQQQYIDRLQDDLTSAKEDRHFILHYWPDARTDPKFSELTLIGYEVKLGYGVDKVWGFAENEHTAWQNAKKALKEWGVLLGLAKEE